MQSAPLRHQPTQARALARVDALLAAARALIEEHGGEGLKMREIAQRAAVPIGSLYRYFPDKAAIIKALALDYMAEVRDGLAAACAAVRTREDALETIDWMTDAYYRQHRDDAVIRDIWFATQADRTLQDIDIADSRENAEILLRALAPLTPPERHPQLAASCFLLMHLTGAALRLAVTLERDEGDAMVEAHKPLLRRELLDGA